ncbi:MAG: GNAT family N-acetyltransferase [Jatrophihabitantaceae bacterium]
MNVQLIPFAEQHLAELAPMVDDPDVARFTRFPTPLPADFLASLFARYQAGRAKGTSELFAAIDSASGRLVGLGLALRIDAEACELELGYLVAPADRGRGVATAMLAQLTDWAFGTGAAIRVSLMIDVENVGSQKAAERCGYLLEGTLRNTYVKRGRRADIQIWSRLASDPIANPAGSA